MKAAILLVFAHSTLVLLGADRLYLEENGYTTYKVFLSVSFGLNVPSATITIETSFLVPQIEITENFILCSI